MKETRRKKVKQQLLDSTFSKKQISVSKRFKPTNDRRSTKNISHTNSSFSITSRISPNQQSTTELTKNINTNNVIETQRDFSKRLKLMESVYKA